MVCKLSRITFMVVLSLSFICFGIQLTYAANFVIDNVADGGDCVELGGVWDSDTNTCTVNNLTIRAGDRLLINSPPSGSASLEVEGTLKILGEFAILPRGAVQAKSRLVNRGSMSVSGTLFNEGHFVNRGSLGVGGFAATVSNLGRLNNHGTMRLNNEESVIENEVDAILVNKGLIDIDLGRLRNFGTMRNKNRIEVSGQPAVVTSSLSNEEGAKFNNQGMIDIRSTILIEQDRIRLAAGTVGNQGRFNNHGTIQIGHETSAGLFTNTDSGKLRNLGDINVLADAFLRNNGTIKNKCGGMIDIQGELLGNPIDDACNDA